MGLLNTLYAYLGQRVDSRRLAEESIFIEQNLIGETVGSQDQIAAAFGGFNRSLEPLRSPRHQDEVEHSCV